MPDNSMDKLKNNARLLNCSTTSADDSIANEPILQTRRLGDALWKLITTSKQISASKIDTPSRHRTLATKSIHEFTDP